MATTGKRTVHLKGFKDTIHFGKVEWHPAGETKMQTGERVMVAVRLDGKLNVKPLHRFNVLMEIWKKDPA